MANVYVPKGSGVLRDNSRVPYKLAFSRALFERLERLRRGGRRVLVMGDFNTAHREIDLARPRENRETSGFLPEERAELDRWLAAGWVDTFRRFEPGAGSLHLVEPALRGPREEHRLADRLRARLARRHALRERRLHLSPKVRGSDHCPVGVEVDAAVLG